MTTIGLHSCRSVPLQVTKGDDLIATSLANLAENDNTSDLQMNQLECGYTQDGLYGNRLQGSIDDGLNANVALQISKLDVFECYARVPFCKYCSRASHDRKPTLCRNFGTQYHWHDDPFADAIGLSMVKDTDEALEQE
ncbi:hypothetical protein GOP47_0030917, partial [Adiantum capillus-veneris]